jgi:hypothetical protein
METILIHEENYFNLSREINWNNLLDGLKLFPLDTVAWIACGIEIDDVDGGSSIQRLVWALFCREGSLYNHSVNIYVYIYIYIPNFGGNKTVSKKIDGYWRSLVRFKI